MGNASSSNPEHAAKVGLVLAEVSLFSLLPEERVQSLAGLFKCSEYGPGQVVVHQGEVGSDFFVVAQGTVNTEVQVRRIVVFVLWNACGVVCWWLYAGCVLLVVVCRCVLVLI